MCVCVGGGGDRGRTETKKSEWPKVEIKFCCFGGWHTDNAALGMPEESVFLARKM